MNSSILSQLIVFLAFLVIILQAIHMILLNQIESIRVNKFIDYKKKYNYEQNQLKLDKIKMISKLNNSHTLDSFGEYYIINNFLVRLNFILKLDLTLVTQCSLSRLHYVIDLLNSYDGPISLSLFVSEKDIPDLIEILVLLRKCQPYFRENVNLHLIYPLTPNLLFNNLKSDFLNDNQLKCSSLTNRLLLFKSKNEENKIYGESNRFPYPGNLLRNVARRNAETDFIMVIDIDIVPSKNTRKDFISFISPTLKKLSSNSNKSDEQNFKKVVYVLPIYEINLINITELFINKTTLLKLVDQQKVRPFYFDLCDKCQKYTNYEKWEKLELTDNLKIAFDINWKDPWEPFYIAENNKFLPFYDERFKQYGFNRISQVCEMHIAGYQFSVLNNYFLLHKGWKKLHHFHKDKDLELEKNRLLFRQFKNELKTKYSNSPRRCY